MYAKTIRSASFPVAWQEAVEFVMKSPEKRSFGGGRETKHISDSQCTIILDEHAVRDVLNHVVHPSDPFATPTKLRVYILEYEDEYDASKFDYTYYDILKRGFSNFNQVEALRVGLQKQVNERLSSNRNIAVLWDPGVHTYSSKAQPCWNEVLVSWVSYGKVKIYTHFRSHDLAAWESNMVAMTEFLNRDVVQPCGCEIVEICESNFSLHIYDYDRDTFDKIKKFKVSPALERLQMKYDSISNPTIFDEFFESKGL